LPEAKDNVRTVSPETHQELQTADDRRHGDDQPGGAQATPFDGVRARGAVDYLLRTQQQNQVQLILLADQKANIVLTLALLMITLSGGSLLDGSPHPVVAVLLSGALLAALLAILVLIPNLRNTRQSRQCPRGGSNLLFFGHAAELDADDFRAEIAAVLAADGRVYDAIAGDLHASARVLHRKYLWLRRSYLVLLVTLVSTGVLALTLLLAQGEPLAALTLGGTAGAADVGGD
jgi:hypothetical protein